MFLADRPAPTGAFDFEALAVPAIGRVLRYAVVGTPPTAGGSGSESPTTMLSAFPRDFHNGNGGVAIGYSYDRDGELDRGSCGGFMWATGEDLRHAADAALAARLAPIRAAGRRRPAGQRHLADGRATSRRSRATSSTTTTNLTMTRRAGTSATSRSSAVHAGSCAGVLRRRRRSRCAPARCRRHTSARRPPPPPARRRKRHHAAPRPIPPRRLRRRLPARSGAARRRQHVAELPATRHPDRRQMLRAGDFAAGGACSNSSCQSGQTPIGPSNFCCNSGQVYTGSGGPGVLQRPSRQRPMSCSRRRRARRVSSRSPDLCHGLCVDRQRLLPGQQAHLDRHLLSGRAAPSGPNKSQCQPIFLIPIGPRCCASGLIPTASGTCCPPANVTTTGLCCPARSIRRPPGPKSLKSLRPAPRAIRRCRTERAATTGMSAPMAANAMSVRGRARPARLATGKAVASRSRSRRSRPPSPTRPPALPARRSPGEGACAPIPVRACPPGETTANQRLQVRRATGLSARRDANPRRQVPAKRAAGLSARRDADRRGQVPAECAACLSTGLDADPRRQVPAEYRRRLFAGRNADPRRQVPAECAACLSAGETRTPRGGVRADRAGGVLLGFVRNLCAAMRWSSPAFRMSAGPVPKSLRRLRSFQGVSRTFPAGGTGEFAPPRGTLAPGQGGETAPMMFTLEVGR